MDLFEVNNNVAIPSTHVLMIEPFKTLWNRDVSNGKVEAIREFTYIELMCSKKKSNPFAGYPEQIRPEKIILNIAPNGGFNPDVLVLQAINYYRKLLEEASPSLQLLNSCEKGLSNLKHFLDTVDLEERTSRGMPVYKPSDILGAVKQVPDALQSLEKLKEKAQQEIDDATKTRGNREIGTFEE